MTTTEQYKEIINHEKNLLKRVEAEVVLLNLDLAEKQRKIKTLNESILFNETLLEEELEVLDF